MRYDLGISVGRSVTSAAARERGGALRVCGLGAIADHIPTVVYLTDDGARLVGDPANRRRSIDPDGAATGFVGRIGDPAPVVLGQSTTSPQALVARVLEYVVEQVSARQGGAPDGLALAHPASWNPYQVQLFAQAPQLAGLDGVRLVTEPAAVALLHSWEHPVEPGGALAVFDLGGASVDATVVRLDGHGGFVEVGRPVTIEHAGGEAFDEAVLDQVRRALGDRWPDGAEALAGPMLLLRRACAEAKVLLSTEDEASVHVALPGIDEIVRVRRSDFEASIAPAVEGYVATFDTVLASARVGPGDLDAVLVVGGSSLVPLVQRTLTRRYGGLLAPGIDPHFAVALGASIEASPERGRPVAGRTAGVVGHRPGGADAAPKPAPATHPVARASLFPGPAGPAASTTGPAVGPAAAPPSPAAPPPSAAPPAGVPAPDPSAGSGASGPPPSPGPTGAGGQAGGPPRSGAAPRRRRSRRRPIVVTAALAVAAVAAVAFALTQSDDDSATTILTEAAGGDGAAAGGDGAAAGDARAGGGDDGADLGGATGDTGPPAPAATGQLPSGAAMVAVPAGEYPLGTENPEANAAETALRTVAVEAFHIDAFEVTNEQYKAFVDQRAAAPPFGWTGGRYPEDLARHPVQGVTFEWAAAYCASLSKTLPTETQWEVAARGGDDRPWPWGDDVTDVALPVEGTYEVGSVPGNVSPFGVHDTTGNVWEWVTEPYDTRVDVSQRVLRGGENGFLRRTATRLPIDPAASNAVRRAGFRCAAAEVDPGAEPLLFAEVPLPDPPTEPRPEPLPEDVLVYDDFSDATSGWLERSEPGFRYGYHPNSSYHLETKGPGSEALAVGIYNAEPGRPFSVRTRATVYPDLTSDGGTFAFGLAFHVDDAGRGLAFVVDPRAGRWQLYQRDADGRYELIIEAPRNLRHEVELEVQSLGDDRFVFEVDGQQVHSRSIPGFAGTAVGLVELSYEGSEMAHIHFDEFQVNDLG